MQCPRCASLVADTVTTCPRCGNLLAQQHAVNNSPASDLGLASTMMASSSPVPPTMMSGGPGSPSQPQYVVTPAYGSPAPQPPTYVASQHAPATMQSGAPMQPQAYPPAPMVQYGPPPGMGYPPSYPMSMPMVSAAQQQGTPGLAVAALICGILGWIPFWIGFILCLLAITFGGIVLAQTKPGHQGRGLAITGLVFGLVLLLPAACGL